MSNPSALVQACEAPKAPPELGRLLTSREREVLALFTEGLGTEATATRLEISRVTVRNHSQRILAKLGVHSRLAAVARSRQLDFGRAAPHPPPEAGPASAGPPKDFPKM